MQMFLFVSHLQKLLKSHLLGYSLNAHIITAYRAFKLSQHLDLKKIKKIKRLYKY